MKHRILYIFLVISLMLAMFPYATFAQGDIPFEGAPLETVITKQPVSTEILIGGKATFTLHAVGKNLSYQWYRIENAEGAIKPTITSLSDNVAIENFTFNGTNTNELKITHKADLSPTPGISMGAGNVLYYCVVTGDINSVESDKVALKLVSAFAETPKVSAGGNLSVVAGESFTLSVTAKVGDGGTLTYQWSRGTVNSPSISIALPGATGPIYTGTAPTTPNLYFYFCTVTNTKDGATASALVTYAVIVQESGGSGEEPPYVFPFTDVTPGKWYYFDVLIAHYNGLINGTTQTTFSPNLNMTTAEAIKLAACMHQLYHTGAVTIQPSTGQFQWYQSYVDYAITNGIISSAGYQLYNEKITREEFVNIFYNALPASEYTVINSVADGAIPDVSMNATYAQKIYTFYRAGILIGSDSVGTFKPKSNILRSEVAAILTRMFDESSRKFITLN